MYVFSRLSVIVVHHVVDEFLLVIPAKFNEETVHHSVAAISVIIMHEFLHEVVGLVKDCHPILGIMVVVAPIHPLRDWVASHAFVKDADNRFIYDVAKP